MNTFSPEYKRLSRIVFIVAFILYLLFIVITVLLKADGIQINYTGSIIFVITVILAGIFMNYLITLD